MDRSRQHYHRAVGLHSTHLNFDNTTGPKYFLTLRFSKHHSTLRKDKLVLREVFGLNCPFLPWNHLNRKTQIQFTGVEVPLILNNHKYSEPYSTKPPLIFSFNAHYLPLVILPQKLSQPIVFYLFHSLALSFVNKLKLT